MHCNRGGERWETRGWELTGNKVEGRGVGDGEVEYTGVGGGILWTGTRYSYRAPA